MMKETFPAPRQLVHLVPRDELVIKLEEGRRRSLTLVQAPAGFGKTTLLSQWQDFLQPKGVTVAWLTLAELPWRAALFIRALAQALGAAGLTIHRADPLVLQNVADHEQTELEAVIRAIEDWGLPLVIILDEYEHCDTPDVNQAVTQIIKRLPVFAHLAITSRQRPSLPIARLYASGQVTLLGPDELRLSPAAAADLLTPYLPADLADRVYQLTEGWAVLLQLVRLWLDAGGASGAVLEALTDQQQESAHFLAEQVLNALRAEERDFLVETSILDRFTPALGDFVRQQDGSARYLEEMSRLYPLVRPLSGDAMTVRVHPLLRSQAQHLLQMRGAAAVAQLHRRAANWYAQAGNTYLAMQHAMAAGDAELAADFFERAGALRLADSEGLPLLERMLSLLPETMRVGRPRVCLAEISALIAFGRIAEARQLYEDLRRRSQDFTCIAAVPDTADFRADLLLTRTFFLVFCDEIATADYLQDLQQLSLKDPDEDLRIRSFTAAYLAVTHLQRGELARAREAVSAARSITNDPTRPYQSTFPIIYEGSQAQISGDPGAAAAKLDEALTLAEERLGSKGNLATLTALMSKADVLVDMGRLAEANEIFYRAKSDFTGVSAWFDVYAAELRVSYALACLTGGAQQAATALDRFELEHAPFPSARLGNILTAYRADIAVRSGDRARLHVEPLRQAWQLLRAAPTATWRELEAVGLALARSMTMLRQFDHALDTLDALEMMAAQHGWRKILTECYLARAMTYLTMDERPRAVGAMQESLVLAHGKGLRGPFLMAVDSAAHLLSVAADELSKDDPVRQFAMELLNARKTLAVPLKLPFLTPREHLVLAELSHGHANKVIARNLAMSENTVKSHLKSIFRKTDVRSRGEAIALARRYFISAAPEI